MDKSSVNALLLDIAKGCILEVDLGASIDFTSIIIVDGYCFYYWYDEMPVIIQLI